MLRLSASRACLPGLQLCYHPTPVPMDSKKGDGGYLPEDALLADARTGSNLERRVIARWNDTRNDPHGIRVTLG
jgi:hypothetical protein